MADPQGILRCRDLVQLYFGCPMVTTIREQLKLGAAAHWQLLLRQDARRIAYEIVAANQGDGPVNVFLGSRTAFKDSTYQKYSVLPHDTLRVDRSFFTDLDEITAEVWYGDDSDVVHFSTRETILTPAPVDEIPPGA